MGGVSLIARLVSVSGQGGNGPNADGQHWRLLAGAGRVDDAAWSLPPPLPEGLATAERICFYPDTVEVAVDGRRDADRRECWAGSCGRGGACMDPRRTGSTRRARRSPRTRPQADAGVARAGDAP